jgi:hypothetical protein
MSLNLKCGAAVAPRTSLQSACMACMGRPMGTFGTWPGSTVCTPMLVLVRPQRHYIAADCDTLGSLVVLTSGDFLVAAACSREALLTNRCRATHTNANVEWPLSKEQAELSSRQYNMHGPPHTKATPHQGFIKVLERLGPITSLPLHWNSQGLNCPSLPVAACIMSSNCSSSVTRGSRDGRGVLRTLNL